MKTQPTILAILASALIFGSGYAQESDYKESAYSKWYGEELERRKEQADKTFAQAQAQAQARSDELDRQIHELEWQQQRLEHSEHMLML